MCRAIEHVNYRDNSTNTWNSFWLIFILQSNPVNITAPIALQGQPSAERKEPEILFSVWQVGRGWPGQRLHGLRGPRVSPLGHGWLCASGWQGVHSGNHLSRLTCGSWPGFVSPSSFLLQEFLGLGWGGCLGRCWWQSHGHLPTHVPAWLVM